MPSARASSSAAVAQPLRAALTGRTTSPGIFDVLAVLGRERKPGAAARSGRRRAERQPWPACARRILQCTTEWATQNSWGFTRSPPARQHEQCTVRSRGRRRSRVTTWTRNPAPTPRSAKLTVGDKRLVVSDLRRHDRAGCDRHRQALRPDRNVHLRSGLHLDRKLRSPRSPTSTATKASCSTAACRSSNWPSTATSSRPATCCSTAKCRPPRRRPTSTIGSPATPWCTSR